MPTKNRVKIYVPQSYYHVYNRGVNKQTIFRDDYDYAVFLNLMKRYLGKTPVKDKKGREYENLYDEVEVLAFCLMPNHFHLLVYQVKQGAITSLLHKISTSYTVYFNKKYQRRGPLFQDIFKASNIDREGYLQHISRYIHLNPLDYKNWRFSSLPYHVGEKHADWVRPARILELFKGENYQKYLSDYEGYRLELEEIKHELANDSE